MLNTKKARQQLSQLEEQQRELRQIRRELEQYRDSLSRSWKGRETVYFERAVSALCTRCSNLERRIARLSRSMDRAVEEIVKEEAKGAAQKAAGKEM